MPPLALTPVFATILGPPTICVAVSFPGHPDIYSSESAAIVPRQVAGLAKRCVSSVAAAKHHTVALTDAGEVWTWGSNRDGRLGYSAVDTQPTPRRWVGMASANYDKATMSMAVERRACIICVPEMLSNASLSQWCISFPSPTSMKWSSPFPNRRAVREGHRGH